MYRSLVLLGLMFCVFAPTNGQFSQSHQTNMMSVTHYLFPSIYTMLTQVCSHKEAYETITITELSTGKLIADSPLVLMSQPLVNYIPVALGFEIAQVTIRDRNGVLHYRSHSTTEKIQLTHLEAGTYILSGIDKKGKAMSVIFKKA